MVVGFLSLGIGGYSRLHSVTVCSPMQYTVFDPRKHKLSGFSSVVDRSVSCDFNFFFGADTKVGSVASPSVGMMNLSVC